MKKLKEISLPMSEKKYHDLDHVSYSFLSKLDKQGSNVNTDEWGEPSDAMKLGTLIESLVFDDFKEEDYYFASEVKPADTLKNAIDDIVSTLIPEDFNNTKKHNDLDQLKLLFKNALEYNTDIGYYAKKDTDWRVTKIFDEGLLYIEYLRDSVGKILMSVEQRIRAEQCAKVIKNHQFTKRMFTDYDEDYMETFNQFKYVFPFNEVFPNISKSDRGIFIDTNFSVKCMLDRIIINHDRKLIQPIDLKTGFDKPEYFQNSYYKWRYDIQKIIYHNAVIHLRDTYYKGYEVLPMKFVYVSTTGNIKPLIYRAPENLLEGWEDFSFKYRDYKGLKSLIIEYIWYKENSFEVEYPESIYKSNGVVEIESKINNIHPVSHVAP